MINPHVYVGMYEYNSPFPFVRQQNKHFLPSIFIIYPIPCGLILTLVQTELIMKEFVQERIINLIFLKSYSSLNTLFYSKDLSVAAFQRIYVDFVIFVLWISKNILTYNTTGA